MAPLPEQADVKCGCGRPLKVKADLLYCWVDRRHKIGYVCTNTECRLSCAECEFSAELVRAA
jgi:hypothetical protein